MFKCSNPKPDWTPSRYFGLGFKKLPNTFSPLKGLDQLSELTDRSVSDVDDYWLSDDKGGTEVSYETDTDA